MSAAHQASGFGLQASGRPSEMFQSKFAELLAEYLAAANLLGRLHTMQLVKKSTGATPKLNTLVAFADDTTVLGFKSVPFEEAIARIRNLTGYTKLAFDGLKKKYQLQAFTIAGTQDVRLIESVRDELTKTLESGGTVDDFRKAVGSIEGTDAIGRTHLETVFQTNVQSAYQNGKLEQMSDPAVLAVMPYWQYRTAGDARVRPAHAALDLFTAKHDDSVWRRIYPPCGYNCRCTVIPLSADEAPADAMEPGAERIPAAARSVPDPGFGGF